MPTIQVRKLDANGDPMRGAGLANFVTDIDAVAQIIRTRLLLLQGEWFLNTSEGLPLFQKLLGHSTTVRAVALVLRERILGTPYVTGINSLSVEYAAAGRNFTFTANVQTQFGTVSISNQ
ncbi:MAG TPA: hypothetical protein VN737_04145 [Bryobacteraceae bacterium]|nr:hypothetical protein [Bryobacteraceae bacterium]